MQSVATIQGVSIVLKAGGEQRLFIQILADDLTRTSLNVKRMGTGAVDCRDRELYIGQVDQHDDPILTTLLTHLDDAMLAHCGAYDVPQKRGVTCELNIGLQFTDAPMNGFAFR